MIWALNGFDPNNANYNDGNVLLDFDPVLDAYLQRGGQLIVVGKDMNDYLPPQIENTFMHVVGWGFGNTITATSPLTPAYAGLPLIGKRTGASNITSVPPMQLDVSGFARGLYVFPDSSIEWMGTISRGYEDMWYQTAALSTRPYRADPAGLEQFMTTLRHDLLGHYPSPTGLAGMANGSQVQLSWDPSPLANVTGYQVMRSALGVVDTLAFVNAPSTTYNDTPPQSFTIYSYWITSAHNNGRTSLPSDSVQQLVTGTVGNGTMVIVNGLDWATYTTEATNLYANHVLQGNRPFRFWDLFTTGSYPAGYTPVGHGTDSLLAAIWSTHTVLWAANGFNGDDADLQQMSPYLDQYLSGGGNLLLVGKDLNLYLPSELTARAMITSWLPPTDWTASDTARAEHPALTDFGKITGSTMSFCPEVRSAASPLVYPLCRKSLSTAGWIGLAARESEASPFNFILMSVRPYRAEPTAFGATMDTLLTDFLGQMQAEPVQNVTVMRVGSNLQLRWQSLPGATSYRITRRTDLSLPTNQASVVATVTGTAWTDPTPIGGVPLKGFYTVFPLFP